VWFFVVSLWWLVGGIVVLVCTIFGRENFPRFRHLFFGWRKGKSKGNQSVARFAFGRAVHAFRRGLFVGLKA
jgi:hypothetical protein